MIRRIALFVILSVFWAYSLPQAEAQDIQVAFLYQHNVSDFGWTFAHDSGRLKMHENLDSKYNIYSEYYEVAPTDAKLADCLALVDGYASRGFNFIVYGSSTYNKCAIESAAKYKAIKHLSVGGNTTTENLAWAFAKIYQVRYLSGLVAGAMTKTNSVGYLAAVKNAQVRYNLNAFYLGLKRANPEAAMNMYWAGTFLNVTIEDYGLESLLNDYDVDVVSYQTSIYAAKFARENEIMSIGYASDARVFYGEQVLTSLLFDWGNIYTRHVEGILNGTWTNQSLFLGMDQGAVRLAAVSQAVRSNRALFALLNEVADQFASGNDTVYCGSDVASYNPALPNGCLSESQILSMSFVLPGINDLGVIVVPDIVYEELYVDYDDGLGIAFMVVAAVCILGTMVIMILTGRYKNTKVFVSASPLFCFLIQGAAIVGYSAVFTWTGRPSQGNCIARAWLVNIGFILLYSALFAKSWRIWVIFRSAKTLRARVIKDKHLLLIGGIFLIPEIVILLVWSGLEPMNVTMMESPLLTALQRNLYCYSTNALTFQLVLILYKAVVLVFGMFIAVATRKVRSDFNESKQIAFSIYNIFFVCVVVLPLLYFLPMGYEVSYALANVLIIWIPSTTILLMFIPKLKIAINNPNQSAGGSSVSTTGSNIENLRVSQRPAGQPEKSSNRYSTGSGSYSNNMPGNNNSAMKNSSTGSAHPEESSTSSSSDD